MCDKQVLHHGTQTYDTYQPYIFKSSHNSTFCEYIYPFFAFNDQFSPNYVYTSIYIYLLMDIIQHNLQSIEALIQNHYALLYPFLCLGSTVLGNKTINL